MVLKCVIFVVGFFTGIIHLVSATEVTVKCNIFAIGVCTVRNEVEISSKDSLKFLVDDKGSIKTLHFWGRIKIHNIPYGVFTTFSGLETLQIDDQNISVLESDRLQGAKLKTIILSVNKIDSIPDNVFDGLPNLRILHLSNNKIRVIRRLAFNGISELNKLYLNFNGIETIEKDALSLHKLEYLSLQMNKLKVIDINGAINLRKIVLTWNSLTHIGDVFVKSTELEEIDLSVNNIESIDDGALMLPNLVKLDLGYNKLKLLSDSIFNGLPNLKMINLERNSLTHVGNAFNGSNKLEQLDISSNSIKDINLTFLSELKNLQYLNLDQSGFDFSEEIPLLTASTSTLKRIVLSRNSLSSSDLFLHLAIFPQLEEIEANSNKFTVFREMEKFKTYLPKLRKLNLKNNIPSLCVMIDENQTWFKNVTGTDSSTQLFIKRCCDKVIQ